MSSTDLETALTAHFGPGGLRRYAGTPGLPGSVGLPVQVGPYFTAAEAHQDPLVEGHGLRLGDDRGAELYVADDGAVRALLFDEEMPVNSTADAFAASLLTLDRLLPGVGGAADAQQALDTYRELRQALLTIDEAAFAEREGWWPRVLDDIRHPLNIRFSAALEYVDGRGEKQIITEATAPGLPHPEEILWHRLSAAGVQPEDVTRVYCELEPCLMPGHYCAVWMARTFPDAEFTHSFDYGETADSREQGIRELMIHVAEQQ
ncbi:nucleic acid/nucleotide deaminase domain-containing protein [Peterkaempfera sp. SMS 1(5)a]|uniref:nucleic acid/nucleotide deaminase domain-containing protein n=1 Tax=Peterkaempfera podocarpi TaxID=3232308 RepID=UPI00366E34FA